MVDSPKIDISLIQSVRFGAEVFSYLKSGRKSSRFLCAHTPEPLEQQWFRDVDANFEAYRQLYLFATGYSLVRGEGYFFFEADPTINRDTKIKTLLDSYRSFVFAMGILTEIESRIGVGYDGLKMSKIQNHIESRPEVLASLRLYFRDRKDATNSTFKKGDEAAFYAEELVKMLEIDIHIVRRFRNELGTQIVFQDSYLYWKEIVDRLDIYSLEEDDGFDPFDNPETEALVDNSIFGNEGEVNKPESVETETDEEDEEVKETQQ